MKNEEMQLEVVGGNNNNNAKPAAVVHHQEGHTISCPDAVTAKLVQVQ